MANEVSSLRQAFNRVDIVGRLEEKNLEKKVSEKGENYISGNLVVGYGENFENKVKVQYFSKELKKDSTEVSKIYKGLETVMTEYTSQADALLNGGVADMVSIKGNISAFDTTSKKTGEPLTYNTIKANFVERVKPEEVKETYVRFSVEMYLESIDKEIVNDEETGRVKVCGIIPIFNGAVIPATFYTTTDESRGGNVGKYILEHYEVGKTVQVNGDIECHIEHKEYTREGMFGSTTQTFDSITNEYIITDGVPQPYLSTDPKHFDKKAIKAAMLYRQERLENSKNETTQSTGFVATEFSKNAENVVTNDKDLNVGNGFVEEDIDF